MSTFAARSTSSFAALIASKQELKERIMAAIEDVNRYRVIHTWSYKLAEAA
jgi:hypothetical protein